MKILYAPDTSDHPNWGCRFMGAWYRRELLRRGADTSWRLGSRWFFRPPAELTSPPTTWDDIQRIGADVRAGRVLPSLARALQDCDLVLMNGENFIRPNVVKGRMLLLLAHLASQVFAKPCILTNLTVDLSDPALAEIVANVLPAVAQVHAREDTSRAALCDIVPGMAVGLYPDVGWTAMPLPVSEWGALARRDDHLSAWPDVVEGFDPFVPYITVSASSVFADDEAATRAAIPAFVELTARLRTLAPQVLLVASCEIDAMIMRNVAARTGLPLLGLNSPLPQAIDVLANAHLHVGGRWHPGIFATTGGTPLVAFDANSHKMRTLMDQLQPEAPVFDARLLHDQMNGVVAQAAAQIDAGEALREVLRRKAAEMAALVRGNLDGVNGERSR